MIGGIRLNGTFKLALASAGVLALTACSYIPGVNRLTGEDGMFRDRQSEYLEAETIPRTRIPDQYDSYIIDDLYVIPEARTSEPQAFLEAPRPRPPESRSEERGVVIQRINDRSWIVVDASPSQVWPRIRDYWRSKGVGMAMENPTGGVMETGWFVLEGDQQNMEKFQVMVEPGFQDASSEIRLTHLSQPQSANPPQDVTWPEQSDDQELSYDLLTELSSYLADMADLYRASSVSFLAGNIPNEGKASMETTGDGRNLLRLQADYERSWAAVGRALERAGVTVTDRNREEGTYQVDFTIPEEEEDKGFFAGLISLDRFRGDEQETHSLRVRVMESESAVDVLVDDSTEEEGTGSGEDPKASLLDTIMSHIA